jgi:hypothetical protein
MELADSIYKSYIFTNEYTEMKGGYQFNNSIKRSIKKSPKTIHGGSDETEYNRFENLVIPIGLVLNSYSSLNTVLPKKEYIQDHMDSELFDKLFDNVKYVKKTSSNTKKSNKSIIHNITKKFSS